MSATPDSALPSSEMPVDLYTSTNKATAKPADYKVDVADSEGRFVTSMAGEFGYGIYPSTDWQSGESVRQHVYLPPLANGLYSVSAVSRAVGCDQQRHALLLSSLRLPVT